MEASRGALSRLAERCRSRLTAQLVYSLWYSTGMADTSSSAAQSGSWQRSSLACLLLAAGRDGRAGAADSPLGGAPILNASIYVKTITTAGIRFIHRSKLSAHNSI